VITRRTALDSQGVRHLVFILTGYPTGSMTCAMQSGVPGDQVDKTFSPITCVECLVFEMGLRSRGQ